MLLHLQSPLLEERVAQWAGCGVAAKGGVKADNGYFVAYTTSVICSFLANASFALRSDRSAALTVHRTVIHYRRLRFAYLKEKPFAP